ncbi:MAG TPA: CBS domain-containing protein [Thermoplasmata archaeon]|nr:CBS domain-containing protein [Thermoplasmata archaeon]
MISSNDPERKTAPPRGANGGSPASSAARIREIEEAQYLEVSELVDRKVRTEAGATLGRLQDFIFTDDPKYAEVTHLVVRRAFGRPPLKVPWSQVLRMDPSETVARDLAEGTEYESIEDTGELLLLRDRILDKRILDTRGLGIDVVYDIQLLRAGNQLFIVAAVTGPEARRRRLGLWGKVAASVSEGHVPEERIPWKYVQPIGPELTSTAGDVRLTVTREALGRIPPVDVADILEELSREERLTLFNALDTRAAALALEATEPRVQREIIADTEAARLGQIIVHLSPVEIADIVTILPDDDARELLGMLKGEVATKVRSIVEEHEVPALTLAVHTYLEFPGETPVEEAFARFRREAPKCLVTMYIYVVDADRHLRGVVDINELLQADPVRPLEEIMTQGLVTVSPQTSWTQVLELFRKYRFRAIPVVDDSRKILGVIREKDAFVLEDEEVRSKRRL